MVTFMLIKAVIAGALTAMLIGPMALAEPVNLVRQSEGYTYFNRSGADLAAMYRDIEGCIARVTGSSSGAGYGPVQGFAGELIAGALRNGMTMVSLENCMVVRGWRIIRVDDKEGAAFSRLPADRIAARLEEWTGSEQAHGTVVRSWANDLTKVDTIKSAFPNMAARPSLSVLAVPRSEGGRSQPGQSSQPSWPAKMNIFKPATPDQLIHVQDGAAILIVTLRNSAPKDFVRLKLLRLGPNQHDPASFTDGRPDTLWLTLPKTSNGTPSGAPIVLTTSFVIPAGRWAIYGVSDVMTACLGTAYFDVGAGAVIYTGAFDFGVDGLPLDPSLEPARAHLQALPNLQGQITLAQWTNGATITCPGTYAYALELPAAPYANGYVKAGSGR